MRKKSLPSLLSLTGEPHLPPSQPELAPPSVLRGGDAAARYRASAASTPSTSSAVSAAAGKGKGAGGASGAGSAVGDWAMNKLRHVSSFASSDHDSDSDASSYQHTDTMSVGSLGRGPRTGHTGHPSAPLPSAASALLHHPLRTLGAPLRTLRMQTLHGQSFFNMPVGATLGDGDAALKDVTDDEKKRVRLWSFFRGHLAYFIVCILVGGAIISGRDGFRYIDGIYLASGSMTGASLAPVVVCGGPPQLPPVGQSGQRPCAAVL